MIETYDNLNITSGNLKTGKSVELGYKIPYKFTSSTKVTEFNICLSDYKSFNQNTLFSINQNNNNNDQDLILSLLKKTNGTYSVKAGNYLGSFNWKINNKDTRIIIKSRFATSFLNRMLNFANDIFLDDVNVLGSKEQYSDISKYIIYYMFKQNLEKAYLLGVPKEYKSKYHHETRVKGKIDFKNFLKKDIPFRGKVSSISREQIHVQEIIDILCKTLEIIKNDKCNSFKGMSDIYTNLKMDQKEKYISNKMLKTAKNCKALKNSLYLSYKKVLDYAELILRNNGLIEDSKGSESSFGFIINVADLFETYISKLLKINYPNWQIGSPHINLYPENFFTRKIIPDIVMKQNNDVLVLDTKYKKMKFKGRNNTGLGDLDRNDFFQINTYMSYYQNMGFNLLGGGLIYPMEEEFNYEKCYSVNWLGNNNTKFFVDGIDLAYINHNDKVHSKNEMIIIKKSEADFIKRINNIIK